MIGYNPTIVTDGLVLYLDAANGRSFPGSGTTWSDLSGNGYNGTLTNGPTYSSDNLGSFSFDGVDDSTDFGDILQLGTDSRTYCCWYKNDSTTSSAVLRTLISKTDNGSTAFRQALSFDSSGNFSVILRAASNSNYDMNTTNPKNDTEWHSLVWVIDRSSSEYLYQDCVLLNSKDISAISSQNFQLNRKFRVGSYNSNIPESIILPYEGKIANVMVYNRALTEDEIKRNFNATRGRFGL